MNKLKNVMKRQKASNLDGKLLFWIFFVATGFLVAAYVLSAFRSEVNADAGYYLGVTELIHKGFIPYRDFCLGYTPLVFYLLQIPRSFMGNRIDYAGFMLFQVFFVFLNAAMLAVLIKKTNGRLFLSLFSSFFYLALTYVFEGTCFLLEPFSVCFGLASMLVLTGQNRINLRAFISGVLVALAFLSKQYGLLFAGAVGAILLFADVRLSRKIVTCLMAFVGFVAVLALFSLFFMGKGMAFGELARAIDGTGYGVRAESMYLKGVKKIFRFFPFILFLPCLFMDRGNGNKGMTVACLAALLLASFQFWYVVFLHYYLFMIPLVLVLNAQVYVEMDKQQKSRVLFLVYFGLLFTTASISMREISDDFRMKASNNLRESQLETASQLRRIVALYQIQTSLCYWQTIQYYALCPLNPPLLQKYGFSFGDFENEETLYERLREADCFVVNENHVNGLLGNRIVGKCLAEDFSLIGHDFPDGTRVFVSNKKLRN